VGAVAGHHDASPGGRWFHVILRVPDGAATALLVFRGIVMVHGFFE